MRGACYIWRARGGVKKGQKTACILLSMAPLKSLAQMFEIDLRTATVNARFLVSENKGGKLRRAQPANSRHSYETIIFPLRMI